MKCEKCNEREATFFYSCNINGEKSSRSLCAHCAGEEGFGEAMNFRAFDAFEGLFSDFFAPARRILPSFGLFGGHEGRIMAPSLPRIEIVLDRPEAAEESESRIPADAGSEIKLRREIAELKYKLGEAVEAEDFEKAIELRDRLRELEK